MMIESITTHLFMNSNARLVNFKSGKAIETGEVTVEVDDEEN